MDKIRVIFLFLVLTVVVPRVTVVDYNLVVAMQIGGEVTTVRQHLCRDPAAIVQVVEYGTLNIVVEVEVGEVVVHSIVVASRTPRGLDRDIHVARTMQIVV